MADRAPGSARPRRERRLRSWWRHERMSIAAALVEATHSAPRSGWPGPYEAPRGQETSSAREEPVLFSLFEEELGVGRIGSVPCPDRKGRCHGVRARCPTVVRAAVG